MRLIVLISVMLFGIAACNSGNKVPKDILGEKKMHTIMWDMMRADEWVIYEQTQDTTLNKLQRSQELYQKVFAINGVTAAQFKKSLQYYQTRPDLLKPILDSIQRRGPRIPTPVL